MWRVRIDWGIVVPIHGLGVTISMTWRLILILSWWWDGREMEPWEGDICFRSPGLCWCHKWQYCDTNDISWDANKTGSYWHVSTNPWQPWSGSCHIMYWVCIKSCFKVNTWIMCYYDTQHYVQGKVLWELVLSSSRLPNPLHHDIRIYINSPAGSRIMSLFLSQMSHLGHYEDQAVCHEGYICRNYWPCLLSWRGVMFQCSSVLGPPSWSHSCLQMFLITPSVPSQLSTENLWPRNRPRMLRERFRGDIRAGPESICVFARTCFAMSSYSISMGHPGLWGPHTRLMHSDPRHWYGETRPREREREGLITPGLD